MKRHSDSAQSFKGTIMQIEKALINDPFACFTSILKKLHSNYL